MISITKFRYGLAIAVIAISAVTLGPESAAHAQLGAFPTAEIPGTPFFDITSNMAVASDVTAGATSDTAVNTTLQAAGTSPKDILSALAWTVAKTALHSLTNSVVKWINSGFQGSPGFVTDLKSNLGNLADTVANEFLNDLSKEASRATGVNINVRSPYQDQIASALRQEFYKTTSSYGFDIQNPYTLGSACSNPSYAQSFTQGKNFSQCGLNGWFALSQNPANNPMQRYELARQALWRQVDSTVQQRKSEIDWGKGYLSWRGPCGPNGTNSSAASKTVNTKVALTSKDPTAGCPIRTPGATIENALGISVTSPFRQLELADNINEIVSALAQQLVNQAFGGGGLSGLSQPAPGGGAAYTSTSLTSGEFANAGSAISANLASAIGYANNESAADDDLIAKYDEAIGKCSASPDTVKQFQDKRDVIVSQKKDRAALVSTITALRGRILAADGSSATQSTTIPALSAEYQTLIGRPDYPTQGGSSGIVSSDKAAATQIDATVSQQCK